jgi:hypothetical protein
MLQSNRVNLGSYAIWKLLFLILGIWYFFIKEINPDIKLQTFLILSQLFCIETLITARFDSIIHKRDP